MTGNQLYSLFQTIIFLVPIGVLLWRFSHMAFQVDSNKRNIDGIGSKLKTVIEKYDKHFDEIEARHNNIERIMERIDEKFSTIIMRLDKMETKQDKMDFNHSSMNSI